MKDIEFKLDSTEIHPNSEIKGSILVSYPGRYDGVVVNTQILDSNELVVYKSHNGNKISQNVSRLFISKESMIIIQSPSRINNKHNLNRHQPSKHNNLLIQLLKQPNKFLKHNNISKLHKFLKLTRWNLLLQLNFNRLLQQPKLNRNKNNNNRHNISRFIYSTTTKHNIQYNPNSTKLFCFRHKPRFMLVHNRFWNNKHNNNLRTKCNRPNIK